MSKKTVPGKAPRAMTGKHRSREATMNKLRKAGLAVFSRYGFDGASTKMVAQRAGINEALISRYFGGKEGLLNAIFLQSAHVPDIKASGYAPASTLEGELVNFLEASIKALNRNPAFLRLMLSRALHSPLSGRTMNKEFQRNGEARLLDRLAEYQARRIIDRSVNLYGTIEILRVFIAGILLHQLALPSSGISRKRTIQHIARAVARTLH